MKPETYTSIVIVLALACAVLVGVLIGIAVGYDAGAQIQVQPDCWRILVEERDVAEGRRLCGFP